MEKKFYIAYGSNMDVDQMEWRCPKAELLGVSVLDGWRLLFKGSLSGAYATVERAEGYKVPILVWAITPRDEERLDRYEGFPNFYYKKSVTVQLNGKPCHAMVYVMHENRPFGEPVYEYYKTVEDAYLRFGFDTAILEKALEDTIAQEQEDDENDDK